MPESFVRVPSRWALRLPMIHLPLYCLLVWFGSPYRRTWMVFAGLAEPGEFEFSWIYAAPSLAEQFANGVNFPSNFIAGALAATHSFESGAEMELTNAVLTALLGLPLWMCVGMWFDRGGFGAVDGLRRIPVKLRVVLIGILSLAASLLVASQVMGAAGWEVYRTLALGWHFLAILALSSTIERWWRSLLMWASTCAVIGEAVLLWRRVAQCYDCRMLDEPNFSFYVYTGWTALLLSPTAALALGWFVSRGGRTGQDWKCCLLSVCLCPLIYFAVVMLAHAVTGNWKYLWLEPTTDLIASRRTLNDFYYLVLRLPIMGAICAAMLCWFWQIIDRARGARQNGDTPVQQPA